MRHCLGASFFLGQEGARRVQDGTRRGQEGTRRVQDGTVGSRRGMGASILLGLQVRRRSRGRQYGLCQ